MGKAALDMRVFCHIRGNILQNLLYRRNQKVVAAALPPANAFQTFRNLFGFVVGERYSQRVRLAHHINIDVDFLKTARGFIQNAGDGQSVVKRPAGHGTGTVNEDSEI